MTEPPPPPPPGPPPERPPGPSGPGWGPPPAGGPAFGQPPFGQPPYGQPPYGQPPYGQMGYPPAGYRTTEGTAVAVLVLAIASFVVCPLVPAIVALAMAPGAKRKIAESQGTKDGEGLITAGVIIAWINVAFAVLAVVAFILFAAAVTVGGTSA